MARLVRRPKESTSKKTTKAKPKEKYVIVELGTEGDVETYHTAKTFFTQKDAEDYCSECEAEEGQLAICKVVSVSQPPQPQTIVFTPY